jgi:hypothetical protein
MEASPLKSLVSLQDLSLDKFFKLLINNDYSVIGLYNLELAKEQAAILISEFYELAGGKQSIAMMQKIIKGAKIEFRLNIGLLLLDILNTNPTADIVKLCYRIGYQNLPLINTDDDNKVELNTLIKYLDGAVKLDIINLDNLKLSNEEKSENIDYKYYCNLIIAIEQTLQITIKESDTSAYKFALLIDKYRTKCEELSKQK